MSSLQQTDPSDLVELPIISQVSSPRPGNDGLLQLLLAEQQQLTAVEAFSRRYESETLPDQARYYSRLLPATPPAAGQQYGFLVDLDRCSGCKACVVACHSLNGLDIEETWRDVGLLVGGTKANPVMQHVTTACHHCLEPGCMSACPVDAYEKDPLTGIVRHLDDQCFGCQYCTLACPYDVPKYHREKGIVRKCDMCSERLADGEAPACVQACPHEAISIQLVDVSQVRENAEADAFLPAAPEPYLTYPTTTYKTSRVFPRNTLPADYFSVSPQHPHWPLILMLVLTQLSVGAFTVGLVLETYFANSLLEAFRPFQSAVALSLGLLALGASTLHLGRPLYAFRAVIGLRHSWLSREIVAFGLFAGAAALYAGAIWTDLVPGTVQRLLGWAVVGSGLLGLLCSVMIYVFTKREFWSFGRTAIKFGLTSVTLGLAATWLALLLLAALGDPAASQRLVAALGPALAQAILVSMSLKLTYEASLFLHLWEHRVSTLKRSALLMRGALGPWSVARFSCGVLGGLLMPLFLLLNQNLDLSLSSPLPLVQIMVLFVGCLLGELFERYLFFAAVSSPRMPGGLRP